MAVFFVVNVSFFLSAFSCGSFRKGWMTTALFLHVRICSRNFFDGKSDEVIQLVVLVNKTPFLEYTPNFFHVFCFSSLFGSSSGDCVNQTGEVREWLSLSASWLRIVKDVDERIVLLLELLGILGARLRL